MILGNGYVKKDGMADKMRQNDVMSILNTPSWVGIKYFKGITGLNARP